MKNKNARYTALLFLLSSSPGYTQDNLYQIIKGRINSLENSVIKDIDFKIPSHYQKGSYDPKKQITLSQKMEKEFLKQRMNFSKITSELSEIKVSLNEYQKTNELEEKEISSLKNSIEYALRIILLSRQNEVSKLYIENKKALYYHPNLDEVYKKLKKADLPGDCVVKNLKIDRPHGSLAFEIYKGSTNDKSIARFKLTEEDFNNRSISSAYKHLPEEKNKHNIETYFQRFNKDNSFSRIHLLESEGGKLLQAGFFQDDIAVPVISFAGFGIGETRENQHVVCSETSSARKVANETSSQDKKN